MESGFFMDYHAAYIKLYGAYGAAIEEIENQNFGRCKDVLKAAIVAAEGIIIVDDEAEQE